jgi:hypothetical protein
MAIAKVFIFGALALTGWIGISNALCRWPFGYWVIGRAVGDPDVPLAIGYG